MIDAALRGAVDRTRPFDLGGHSLGGALGNIAAHELVPGGYLITYGAPRVGNAAFALAVDTRAGHVRVTRQADPVPLVPPASMGFKHGGTKIYIDADGQLRRNPSFICEAAMRAASALAEGRPVESALADHAIARYAEDLEAAARG
ncbi:MAG: lipase family protein [Rhodospirillales bacterium]|nr:lipase family protein [Rhodospirillales bacterium]